MNTQKTNKIAESPSNLSLLLLALLISIAFSIPASDFDISTIIFVAIIFLPFIVIKYFKIGLAIYFIFLICWAIVLESADGFGVAAGGLIGFVTIFPYSIILGISHFKFARKKNESLTKWSIVVFSLVYFMGYLAMLIALDIIHHRLF